MALALSIGVFGPKINEFEQLRNNNYYHVARVPMIPLYSLSFLKYLYVVVVFVLAIGVDCFTHPLETEAIREQLSAKSLAMAHFMDPDLRCVNVVGNLQSQLGSTSSEATTVAKSEESDMPHEEHEHTQPSKVGFVRTSEGGWTFALLVNEAWESVKPIVKVVVLEEAKEKKLGVFGDAYVDWKK